MEKPQPKETKGVPWADHNETETSPPDTRREEYGNADPDQTADERASEATPSGDTGSGATERPSDEDRAEIEHDL